MNLSDLHEKWLGLDARAKAFAIGTALVMAVSVFITAANLAGPQTDADPSTSPEAGAESPAAAEPEGEGLIPEGAEPIVEPTAEQLMLSQMLDVITKGECLWQAAEDPACWLEFTRGGFTEYDGDLVTSATAEFYSIRAVDGGREGTWRVIYADGATADAAFAFTQDRESGTWVFSSEALPTHDEYRTAAFTSEDVLSW